MRYLTIIFSLISYGLSAQISQPERIEIPLERGVDNFTAVSAEENGIVIFRDSDERDNNGNHFWDIRLLDTLLETTWEEMLPLKNTLVLTGYDYHRDHLLILFEDGIYQNKNYFMLEMNVNTRDTVHHQIRRPFPISLEYFETVDQTVILGGVVNYKPAVIHYDLITRKVKVLPGIYKENGSIIDLEPNDSDNTLDVLMTEPVSNKRVTVTLKTYDQFSNLLQSSPIRTNDDSRRSLLDATAAPFDGRRQYIAGTYGRKRSDYSNGLFIASVTPVGEQQIRFINYADLNNFFNFMRDKREARIRRRIARKKAKNKRIRFNYRVNVHNLIKTDGKYILLGEAYYPKYNNSYFYNDFYSNFSNNPQSLYFDGYRMTHAIVVCFSGKGRLLWDYSFRLDNLKSNTLDQVVHAHMTANQLILMYAYEGKVKTQVIEEGELVSEDLTTPLRLQSEQDELRNTDEDLQGFSEWYDDYFFVFGEQKIKNSRSSGFGNSRNVFFINKINYGQNPQQADNYR